MQARGRCTGCRCSRCPPHCRLPASRLLNCCRGKEGQELWPAIQRILSILIGFALAVLAQTFIFPVFARRQLTERLAAALEDSVALLYGSALQAGEQPAGKEGGGGSDGSRAAAASRRTAALQRKQRKQAAGLDGLLGPAAVVSGSCGRRAGRVGSWHVPQAPEGCARSPERCAAVAPSASQPSITPRGQELKLLPGPLSAADFGTLVDSAAAVGSTAVHLTAVLEAVHANVAGTEHQWLPPDLEVGWGAEASAP